MTTPLLTAWSLELGLFREGPFGGGDRRTLFVTTGRERLEEAALERQPNAGRVAPPEMLR